MKCEKLLKTNDKKNKLEYDLLLKIKDDLNQGRLINLENFEADERIIINGFQLLSAKPTFYIANISDDGSSEKALESLQKFAEEFMVITHMVKVLVIPSSLKNPFEIKYS